MLPNLSHMEPVDIFALVLCKSHIIFSHLISVSHAMYFLQVFLLNYVDILKHASICKVMYNEFILKTPFMYHINVHCKLC
jgi:hypothetical protein